jgi:hypothetical protein
MLRARMPSASSLSRCVCRGDEGASEEAISYRIIREGSCDSGAFASRDCRGRMIPVCSCHQQSDAYQPTEDNAQAILLQESW